MIQELHEIKKGLQDLSEKGSNDICDDIWDLIHKKGGSYYAGYLNRHLEQASESMCDNDLIEEMIGVTNSIIEGLEEEAEKS